MTNSNKSQRKFTFDTEFFAEGEKLSAAARARQKRTLTAEELDVLQANARKEGERAASVRVQEALERTLAAMTIALRAALENSHAEVEVLRHEAASLALAMGKKIASAAVCALPERDVESALRQAMHQAFAEPRITLRAAPLAAETLEPRLAEIAQEEGYGGRVMINADPSMAEGDCRIEWRAGGSERSAQMIEEALAAIISHRFSQTDGLKG